ncbi:DUF4386 domain-containing protein [Ktedonobacter sp. SOSP1-52]|uniref:DUF4386 domain-containing protein n=1 Tax=Ktedonobacter sp. SOSP1-52 TaxID=2778366 RepID=UPI001F413E0F|nr:DUF4386 domain-containing protein [Ktedonobacter sp. SOSP1-52]
MRKTPHGARLLAEDARIIGNSAGQETCPVSVRKRSIMMTMATGKTTRAGPLQADREAVQMSPRRKTALVAGVLYLLTFVSIPTLFIYGSVKSANYIIGAGPDTAAIIGGILEIIVALAGIGTAVVLFPVLKKQNEAAALGLVASRILESGTIFVGVAFLMSIVTLRQAGAGAGALVTSHALATLYDRIFLQGQSFMPAICDLLLGFLLYQSRLVPRGLALIGIVGGPILLAGYLAVMFGLLGLHAPLAGLSAVPVALFEFSLGVWLVVKGFQPSPILSSETQDASAAVATNPSAARRS